MDNAGWLDFNHSVRHQLDESGHKCFHCLYGFKELDAYWEVLATAAGCALGMETMMRSESRVSAQHGCSRDPIGKQEGDYLQVKIVPLGSNVFVQVNYDLLGWSRYEHSAVLEGSSGEVLYFA
jgi:hypothetical protein